MAGDATHPVSQAPRHYVRAGAERTLAGKGVLAGCQRVAVRHAVHHDVPAASAAVNQELRTMVRPVAAGGQFPIVLAGSCDAAIGVVAGLNRGRCGVVWVDAHGDFNTHEDRTLRADLRIIELLGQYAADH